MSKANCGYVTATEVGIRFIHVRCVPNRKQVKLIKAQLEKDCRNDEFDSLVVTLAKEFEPLGSFSCRHAFEAIVVEGGGQLCFVDYGGTEGRVHQELSSLLRGHFGDRFAFVWPEDEASERLMRAELIAESMSLGEFVENMPTEDLD